MRRKVKWVGSSYEALNRFPKEVRRAMGYALYLAEIGERSPHADTRYHYIHNSPHASRTRARVLFSTGTLLHTNPSCLPALKLKITLFKFFVHFDSSFASWQFIEALL